MTEEYREYRVRFQWPDGTGDHLVISGYTEAERLESFNRAMASRNATCAEVTRIL